MDELRAILKLWDDIERSGGSGVLATVVRVCGSAYRRPGARMLFTPDGRRAGSISGGCLEADLIRKAHWWLDAGKRVVRRYDTGSSEDGASEFGLGCGGVIDLLLETVGGGSSAALRLLLEQCRYRRKRSVVATVVESDERGGVRAGSRLLHLAGSAPLESDIPPGALSDAVRRHAQSSLGGQRSSYVEFREAELTAGVSFEVLSALPLLSIFGTGHDAVPLASLAAGLGWDVDVVDLRGEPASEARFSESGARVVAHPARDISAVSVEEGSAAVVMTHSYELDRMLLRTLLRRPLSYLGLLGPRERTRHLLADIGTSVNGGTESGRGFLHAPAGLDIGGDSPAAIALSIVAEIQAVYTQREGGMLRDRHGPIHDHWHEQEAMIRYAPQETRILCGM